MRLVGQIAEADLHREFVKHGKEIPNCNKRKQKANKPAPRILQQKVGIENIAQSRQQKEHKNHDAAALEGTMQTRGDKY